MSFPRYRSSSHLLPSADRLGEHVAITAAAPTVNVTTPVGVRPPNDTFAERVVIDVPLGMENEVTLTRSVPGVPVPPKETD